MKHRSGFTLIEVIIIIVIISIAAALFISYTLTAYTRSPASTALVSEQYKLIQQMEILTIKYRQALEAGGGTVNLCTDPGSFKTTYVDPLAIDGVSIVDAANTSCAFTITDSTNTYTTATGNALRVTLTYKGQRLQSIFTK